MSHAYMCLFSGLGLVVSVLMAAAKVAVTSLMARMLVPRKSGVMGYASGALAVF